MRKVILFILMFVGLTLQAQFPFKGFLRPVDKDAFKMDITIDSEGKVSQNASFWLFRPAVTVSAMQFIFENPVKVSTLTSLGTGISYSHFINQDDLPYQNFAANLLILFGTEKAEPTKKQETIVSPVELSVAGTVTLWQNLSFGAGYNFADKKAFLLTGVTFNFNR